MISTQYKITKQGIKEHAKSVREFGNMPDQTEINCFGARLINLYPTPIQQLIEGIATNGTAYTDSPIAPCESGRLSLHLGFKRDVQGNPLWTDEEFNTQYPFVKRTINEYGLQEHLLEMERRTQGDESVKSELSKLYKKNSDFTDFNFALNYHAAESYDRCSFPGIDGHELHERLNKVNKKDAVKYFQVLDKCNSVDDVMKSMDWRYYSKHLQGRLGDKR